MSKLNWRQRLRNHRQGSVTPEEVARNLEAINSELEATMSKLDAIDTKLDRMWHHIDLIRTHSATYLGNGVSLTYLPDQSPVLVNTPDYYGPLNLINGGRYEEENISLLFSFVDDHTRTFVDAGANLGYFSLRLAERLRQHGRVIAFEPHPRMAELTRYNAIINGLEPVVTVHQFGLSDEEAEVDFSFPKGHMGGGVIGNAGTPDGFEIIRSCVRKLDDVLGADATVDLMKIDVEGHEPAVMRGMQGIMARSPHLKILFEKLGTHVGHEPEIEALLRPFGFQIYAVNGDAQLSPIGPGELSAFSGCGFAARPEQVAELDRRRFSIYPSQLAVPGRSPLNPGELLIGEGPPGQTLFHGPYWALRPGTWELQIHGTINGEIEMHVAERRGFVTNTQRMSAAQMRFRFRNELELTQFELVARPVDHDARVEIDRLEMVRVR